MRLGVDGHDELGSVRELASDAGQTETRPRRRGDRTGASAGYDTGEDETDWGQRTGNKLGTALEMTPGGTGDGAGTVWGRARDSTRTARERTGTRTTRRKRGEWTALSPPTCRQRAANVPPTQVISCDRCPLEIGRRAYMFRESRRYQAIQARRACECNDRWEAYCCPGEH